MKKNKIPGSKNPKNEMKRSIASANLSENDEVDARGWCKTEKIWITGWTTPESAQQGCDDHIEENPSHKTSVEYKQ